MDKQFVVVQHQGIFESDAAISIEALTSNASSPSEISAKFGSISYSKGKYLACHYCLTINNYVYVAYDIKARNLFKKTEKNKSQLTIPVVPWPHEFKDLN